MFFLAGPINGGEDWHLPMSSLLEKKVGSCIIVNPSRYAKTHRHALNQIVGQKGFEYQLSWERYYLNQAASVWPTGCAIFWLPPESKLHPRNDGKPYAMDTRGEIGEWRGRMMHDKTLRVVIGGKTGFPGFNTIMHNFEGALGDTYPIYGSMHDVVERAAWYANPANSFESRVSR